ncbi:hypothetical protein CKO09_12745 [Chromatium weissei]|nr:hypothetical protein [Chromatium weissei]
MELSTGTDCNCQLPLPTLITPEPTQSTALLVLPVLNTISVITAELSTGTDCDCPCWINCIGSTALNPCQHWMRAASLLWNWALTTIADADCDPRHHHSSHSKYGGIDQQY